jgi:hypothetical protein
MLLTLLTIARFSIYFAMISINNIQGEVEQISLMKPKAENENEEGMLEYLVLVFCSIDERVYNFALHFQEDIIGYLIYRLIIYF